MAKVRPAIRKIEKQLKEASIMHSQGSPIIDATPEVFKKRKLSKKKSSRQSPEKSEGKKSPEEKESKEESKAEGSG